MQDFAKAERPFPMKPNVFLYCVIVPLAGCSAFDPDSGTPFGGSGSCGSSSAPPNIGAWDAAAATLEQRVLELTNQNRARGGCCGTACFNASRPLAESANLRVSARLHARDMVSKNFFSHDSADGRTLIDRVTAAGFGGCAMAENIAQGQLTAEAVMTDWMASVGHCANVLSPSYAELGVGFFDDPAAGLRRVWVQNFGG